MLSPFGWHYIRFGTDYPHLANHSINALETITALHALQLWAPLLTGYRVVVHTDNTTCKATLSKRASKNPALMPYLRELFWRSRQWDFQFSSSHIPGALNSEADGLSRLHERGHQLHVFRTFMPCSPMTLCNVAAMCAGNMSSLTLLRLLQDWRPP